jgi:4-hydroxybenzoate polyprenyltransferase
VLTPLKNKLKEFGVEFIYGGHLLSLGASAIVLTTTLLLGLTINLIPLLIAYLISQIVYTYDHYIDIAKDSESNPERSEYLLKRKRSIRLLLIIYFLFFFLLCLLTNVLTFTLSVIIVSGGILYTSFLKEYITRRFAGFKNIYTSFFWAILILLIPFFYGIKVDNFFILFGTFVFLRLFVNTVFFDIKDIKADRQERLKTFATILGKKGTLVVLLTINLFSIVPLVYGINNGWIPLVAYSLTILVIYTFVYLTVSFRINDKQLRILSYVVVDGEYLFWPLLIFLFLNF